jgi:hydrogenase expression/formation protein HypE
VGDAVIDCPVPASAYDRIVLGHGSGGRLTAELIERVFRPSSPLEDQATLAVSSSRIAFTTDAFVVRPLVFPGGDIGKLAVHGTINDLAVGGATPRWISAAFILEEGLAIDELRAIVDSMREACATAGVQLVTGDTKVVERGKGDQVFITTSGIGALSADRTLSIGNARPGDKIIVSGTLGDHGIAILSVREGLEFETALASDTQPLHDLCHAMLEVAPRIRCMRDPTRGGLSSALHELAAASAVGVRLDEVAIPLQPAVRAACDLLGLDPLYVACEGRVVAVVPSEDADRLVAAMRAHPKARDAAIVGEVVADHPRTVVMHTRIGGERIVSLLAGEQLPRIC